MIDTTVKYCEDNTAATAGITNFATTITAIKGKLVLINGLNQIGTGTTTGVTTDTNVLRNAMSDLAIKCANGTIGYANSVNNNTLKALVNYTRSKLDKMKKEDVDDACEAIHDATNTNIANVTSYGVTASDVTDLQTAIGLYRTGTQNPRQAIISKSQAIKQAIEMVREVIDDLLVGQLDVMANTLKISNKDFWNGYHQAREIVDLGTTHAKVRGTVLDENDVPLKQVVFTIYETGTSTKVAEAETDVKGKYVADKLPSGNFDFKWEKYGFKTVREDDVHISPGKELKRKIVMDAAIVREGDVGGGAIINISLDNNGAEVDPAAPVTVEVTGSSLRFYASNMPNTPPSGTYLEVQAGSSIEKTVEEFITLLGVNEMNKFISVQNVGMLTGHYKIMVEV